MSLARVLDVQREDSTDVEESWLLMPSLNASSGDQIQSTPLMPGRVIPLRVVCAVCASVFTCAGGFIVYTNTQHLISTRNWLDHFAQRSNESADGGAATGPRGLRDSVIRSDGRCGGEASCTDGCGVVARWGESLLNDNASQMRHLQDLDTQVRDVT